jgi:prephenate dehydrogenase
MKPFHKVTIIGVGLLGGSIGLALKKKRLAREVVGFFRDKKKIAAAVKTGAIDTGTSDLKTAVCGSDFIILCSPIHDIIEKLKSFKKWGLTEALLTDTGSTKAEIVKNAQGLDFVGSHPLAGSEQSGIAHAADDLFINSVCLLTPTSKTRASSVARIREFWKILGAQPVALSAQEHDRILSLTSHLPHAAAFSLVNAIPLPLLRFSAGGLRDTTRIALSNPDIWMDIFLSNKRDLCRAVSCLEKTLREFKNAVAGGDRKKILRFLKKAQNKRINLAHAPTYHRH